MVLRANPVSDCRSGARFCLLWGLVSSLGSALGVVGGIVPAYWVGVVVGALGANHSEGFALSVATVGAITGAVVGFGQSFLLRWSVEARFRWVVRNLCGWGLGAGAGGFVALLCEVERRGGWSALSLEANSIVMVVMPPILGLVLGVTLWTALPSPAPRLAVWLVANAIATSFGWWLAWLVAGSSSFLGLTWQGIVLGPLVYAMITGTMMLWVECRRASSSHRRLTML